MEISREDSPLVIGGWTRAVIIRNIFSLAWPIMVSSSLQMVGPTIDMIWVGKLGTASIAGVGVAGMVVQMVISLMMGITIGARAMIARFWGAGDTEGANHITGQAFMISAIFAIIIAVVGIFLTEQIMSLFGLELDVITEGASYMRIMFVGSVAMSFLVMAQGVMQASGDTVTPMWVTLGSRLLHIALAPFLIFGWWIFPSLGVSGAAVTNVISQSLGVVLILWFLFSGRNRLQLNLRNFRVDPNILWRMVKIGIPASLTMIQYQFGTMVLMWVIAPFGTLVVAAHTVVERAQMFVQMPAVGIGMAAGILAGQNMGAGRPEQAKSTGWLAIGLVQAVMFLIAVATFLWAENLIQIFSSDPVVLVIGSAFLKISIIGFFFFGTANVLYQCLSHIGDTLPPLLMIVTAVWAIELPLAFFLSRYTDLGAYAIRWAIVAHLGVLAVAYIAYFQANRWKRKEV
ncbi:MATE family efflux transporter [Chloroflexota bacterium]